MAERARLEIDAGRKSYVSSNLTLSAVFSLTLDTKGLPIVFLWRHGDIFSSQGVNLCLVVQSVRMLSLSDDQKRALKTLIEWYTADKREKYITLGGYAGTGKSTLIARLRLALQKLENWSGNKGSSVSHGFRQTASGKPGKIKVAFCSYTGKATRVLKSKLLEEKTFQPRDTISTIHGLIYSPIENDQDEIVGWERKESIDADLIIVDEASMVDKEIWRDLLSFGIRIIAVGDHGQLPPIGGSFNLMEKPMLRLEKIHRQAEDNPIVKLSIYARERGAIPVGAYGRNIEKLPRSSPETGERVSELLENYTPEMLVLCGFNQTRVKLNKHIRYALGFDSMEPQARDRIICLRNNHEKQVYNGMLGTIKRITSAPYPGSDRGNIQKSGRPDDTKWYELKANMDGEEDEYRGLALASQFGATEPFNFTKNRRLTLIGDLFEFGYALTVHKAQGSQAKRVVLFEERFSRMSDEEWSRWLYTAVTRAEEELFIIGD